ncbi:MAG: glycosyltransferase family 2 protein [Holosporales bacterium]|jgi:glycosyltransferase involved in cell wall biosynthesis|nr:glycosyltransferase family 2 protein [Holosporales bacterium]
MNSSLPLVSIIIPTHFRLEKLKNTLRSITEQTYKNIEIIVSSDGFSDENRNFLEKEYPSIVYIESKVTKKPSIARNLALKRARGRYIAFCDDDDLWLPEKLEKQIQVLEIHKDRDFCYTKMVRYDNNGKEWMEANDSDAEVTFKSLLFVSTVPISSVIIRAELLDKVKGFCESKRVGTSEDYEFVLRCAVYTKPLLLDEYLVKYYSGNERTTNIEDKEVFRSAIKVIAYTLGVLGGQYSLLKIASIEKSVLFKSILHHLKWCYKRVAYITILQWIRRA